MLLLNDVFDALLSFDVNVVDVDSVELLVVVYPDDAVDVVVVVVLEMLFDPFLPDVIVDIE